MRQFLSALLVAGLSAGAATGQSFTCIDEGGRTVSRVIGGDTIPQSEAPYQVALYTLSEGGGGSLCGGSLISRGHILTAAHCVADADGRGGLTLASTDKIYVLYGGNSREAMVDAKQLFPVAEIHVHPVYDGRVASPGDIAVVRLRDNLDVPQTAIMTLASAPMERALMTDYTCARVTGYGRTEAGKASDLMRSANLYVRPRADCLQFRRNITEQMICAGYEAGDITACQGDSGGPLVIREGPTGWVQVGVVSWGARDCKGAGNYGVFTRVSSFVPWIREVTSR